MVRSRQKPFEPLKFGAVTIRRNCRGRPLKLILQHHKKELLKDLPGAQQRFGDSNVWYFAVKVVACFSLKWKCKDGITS